MITAALTSPVLPSPACRRDEHSRNRSLPPVTHTQRCRDRRNYDAASPARAKHTFVFSCNLLHDTLNTLLCFYALQGNAAHHNASVPSRVNQLL